MKLPHTHFLNRDAFGHCLRKFILLMSVSMVCAGQRMDGADQYWRIDGAIGGTWTSSYWSNPASATGGTAWTDGSNAIFTANSTLTFSSSQVGNITVADGKTVTVTKDGTLSLGGAVRTFDIGSGALLDWRSQEVSANTAAGITKNGVGTLRLDALTFTTNMNGGFTLNAGTVIVNGAKAFGNGAMSINGGSVQSSGGNTFAVTSIVVGGDFSFAGTGNDIWDANVNIGSSTRTITNNTTSTATRTFSGAISGTGGLTFDGVGGSGGIVLSGSSSYDGGTTVSQGMIKLEGGTTANPTLKNTSSVAVSTGGTLLFSGTGSTNNKLNTVATVTLAGGKLNTGGLNGLDQSVGALTLTANSIIDFGALASGSQSLRFAASNGDWTGLTLSIWNWTAGVDHLYFGTSASGLNVAQLGRISFYGGSGTGFLGTATIASNGELSAIPESSTVLTVVGLAGLIGAREFRRRSSSTRRLGTSEAIPST